MEFSLVHAYTYVLHNHLVYDAMQFIYSTYSLAYVCTCRSFLTRKKKSGREKLYLGVSWCMAFIVLYNTYIL